VRDEGFIASANGIADGVSATKGLTVEEENGETVPSVIDVLQRQTLGGPVRRLWAWRSVSLTANPRL
jgi:hypothetical protein